MQARDRTTPALPSVSSSSSHRDDDPTSAQRIWRTLYSECITFLITSREIHPERFMLREATHPNNESALLMWLHDAQARNIPVNGLLLRKRAEQLVVVLGNDDVTFSNGPFQGEAWRDVHASLGEFNSASVDAITEWKANVLPMFLARYEDKDIFNSDESGLFYKTKPNRRPC